MSDTLPAFDPSDGAYERELLGSPRPVVLFFTAPGCAACRAASPVLSALAQRFSEAVRAVRIDADASPELATRLDVRALPTVLLIHDGAIVQRRRGYTRARPLIALFEAAAALTRESAPG